jgi:pilus assembly protein CpaE
LPINLCLVGSTDREFEQLLRDCGMRVTLLSGADLDTLAQATTTQPDVAVVDLREQSHLPPALTLLRRHHPGTGIVIVASLDPVLMLEAMRAGVTECITEPLRRADLEAAIGRVVTQRPMGAKAGQVFAFLGAKGGVGTTTVAVNIAAALAQTYTNETLLIDLHLINGDASVFLGAEPSFSVIDALDNTHRLDEAFFRTLVIRTKSGVDLLASSARAQAGPIDVRRIRNLLEFAASHYRFVVLDVPRSDAVMVDALESAVRIVVVLNQELATVRNASRVTTTLRRRYGENKVTVVVSRSDRLAEIGCEDVERAVGGAVKQTFPSDYRLSQHALNKGRPISLDNHNALSASFRKFAHQLVGTDDRPGSELPISFLDRLTGRRSTKREREQNP